MSYGIYQATAGAVARRNQVDIVANNVANSDTPGYRAQEVTFEGVLNDVRAPQRQMVVSSDTRLDLEPAVARPTGRPHDFALQQRGYLAAWHRSGGGGAEGGGRVVLLRTTGLGMGLDGHLRSTEGHLIMDDRGLPIELEPAPPFEVTPDGYVMQSGQRVAHLRFVNVADETGLETLGAGAYAPTETSGEPFEVENRLVLGHLESSNVKPLEGMVKLISLERGYQATMKVIQAYREADEQLIERTSR